MTPQDFIEQFENSKACSCGHSQNSHTRSGVCDLGHGRTFAYVDGCTECECEEFAEKNIPYWECQECLYQDKLKPMPNVDATTWYARRQPLKCPRCKSEAFQPVGW